MRKSMLQIVDQPSEQPERKDAQRNRERILAAARQLLHERPMAEICMDALAEAAGVGKGTLYRRFKDRSSLCLALLDDATRQLQAATIKGLGLSKDTAAEERLAAFISALVTFTMDNAPLLAEARAWASDRNAQLMHPAHTWIIYELSRLLQLCGQGAQEAELLSHWIFTALDPHVFMWQLSQGIERGDIARSVQGFIMRGIRCT
jgi:AcrR family transcriptional regulator